MSVCAWRCSASPPASSTRGSRSATTRGTRTIGIARRTSCASAPKLTSGRSTCSAAFADQRRDTWLARALPRGLGGVHQAPGASMVIKGYNVGPLLKKTVKEIGQDRIPTLAASTAYYFFFSLFPLLLFLTPLLGIVGNGQQLMESMLSRLSTTLPADALSLLRKTLDEIVKSSGGAGVMSIGVILAGWSGSGIFGSLMEALNVAYDATETRPWWKQQLLRLACL